MTNTAPRARDARGRFVALVDRAAEHVTPADVVPAIVTPGPAHLHPAAAQAVRIAFNGHRNIMTPDRMGFATCDGLFAVEYSRGTGFFDRATGTTPDIFAATVVCLKSRRPLHSLSRCFTTPDSLGRYVGKLDYLARYRARRAAVLARANLARVGEPAGWYEAGSRKVAQRDLVYLRAQFRVTLERFGCEAPVPGDDAPPAGPTPTAGDIVHGAGSRGCGLPSAEVEAARARIAAKRAAHAGMVAEYGASAPRMVPMPVQQQQACAARPGGPASAGASRYGADMGRRGNAWATFDTSERLTLQRVRIDRGGYDAGGAYWGLGQPLYWLADEAGNSAYLRAADRHAAAAMVRAELPAARFAGIANPAPAPRMVPMPVQQQQARDMRGPITGEITLPVYWAAYLINGDASGLNDGEAEQCDAHLALRLPLGADVVDVVDGSERFTWSFQLYGGEAAGGDVATYRYIVHPCVDPASEAPCMVPMPVQQQQARHALVSSKPARRGIARSEGDGTWQVGIYCLARNDAGAWVATATGPGTIGDGYVGTWPTWAAAYEGVTGEPAPGARPAMVPMPVQQQQAQHRPCPVEVGPTLYDVLGGIGARVGRGLGLKPACLARLPWAAPVVVEVGPSDADLGNAYSDAVDFHAEHDGDAPDHDRIVRTVAALYGMTPAQVQARLEAVEAREQAAYDAAQAARRAGRL